MVYYRGETYLNVCRASFISRLLIFVEVFQAIKISYKKVIFVQQ